MEIDVGVRTKRLERWCEKRVRIRLGKAVNRECSTVAQGTDWEGVLENAQSTGGTRRRERVE